jgi:hypothetical protein
VAGAFHAADPHGFFVAEIDGEKIGCISAVRYDDAFGFIGFYIVRPEFRGKGYGLALWERGMAHLDGLPVGLDGVPAQRANYERSGFAFAYANVRYRADTREPRDRHPSSLMLERLRVADDDVLAYDAASFGTSRPRFLQPWIVQPDVVALTARDIASGELLGLGVGRDCGDGTKIGPLFCSRLDVAGVLLDTIMQRTGSPWYLDVPTPNAAALALANEREMTPVFETARMWRGEPPPIALERVYGVTSLELG